MSILRFNKETGYYEGTVLVQVDAEIFRRMLLKAIEEDATADLTNPAVWTAKIASVGKVTNWLNRPHVRLSSTEQSAQKVVPSEKTSKPALSQKALLEQRLQEKAMATPPYLWEERCLTPLASPDTPKKVREEISRIRSDERAFLKKLKEAWQSGQFLLLADAAKQQATHEQAQQEKVAETLSTVAALVNGNKIH